VPADESGGGVFRVSLLSLVSKEKADIKRPMKEDCPKRQRIKRYAPAARPPTNQTNPKDKEQIRPVGGALFNLVSPSQKEIKKRKTGKKERDEEVKEKKR